MAVQRSSTIAFPPSRSALTADCSPDRTVAGGPGDCARELLLTRADVDARDGVLGETALETVARDGDARTVQLLLEAGAEVNTRGGIMEETALGLAARQGHADIVRLLLAAGARPTGRAGIDRTALGHAAEHGHTEIAAMLIQAGANVNAVGKEQRTALGYAVRNGHARMASLLLRNGAKPEQQDGVLGDRVLDHGRRLADGRMVALLVRHARQEPSVPERVRRWLEALARRLVARISVSRSLETG